jgi:acyl-CoA synthetase (AMP-forming)/AMP-acid ligase II
MGAINIILVSATRADDIYLNTIPLFHVGLTTFFLLNLVAGGTNVLMRAFDPREALEIIQREKVTTTWLVPAMTIAVLSLKDVEKYDLSSLRIWYSGGAILPTEIRNRLMNLLKGIAIFDIFGQTETNGCTTALRHNDGLRKTASVGQPLGTIEIRIVDDEDNVVPPGESGELCYRGPSLFTEYYKNPAETETAWRNGWFHSGDIVRQDEEGFVYVVDRKKDIIVTGGENVASKEVEEVIFQHPKILEAAVIGVPHEKWGETIKAVAVLKPGEKMTEEELINFCKDRVAGYKKPTSVDFIDALPRSSTGKVLKYELRKKYGPAVKY